MLIERRTEHDDGHQDQQQNGQPPAREPWFAHGGQREFPTLEEPGWLEDDLEEMEAPRDNALRGIWIGIAAAAATFVLVFAVPYWLGWYNIGPAPQQVKRDGTAESVIATVTAKPSVEAPAATTPAPAATSAPVSPAVTPPVTLPPAAAASQKGTSPPTARVAPAPVTPSKRTFSVQIAAFKDAKQAGRLAERVKKSGYPADVRRMDSPTAPWAVRVGTYSTRDQAESARAALARQGFRGFIL